MSRHKLKISPKFKKYSLVSNLMNCSWIACFIFNLTWFQHHIQFAKHSKSLTGMRYLNIERNDKTIPHIFSFNFCQKNTCIQEFYNYTDFWLHCFISFLLKQSTFIKCNRKEKNIFNDNSRNIILMGINWQLIVDLIINNSLLMANTLYA